MSKVPTKTETMLTKIRIMITASKIRLARPLFSGSDVTTSARARSTGSVRTSVSHLAITSATASMASGSKSIRTPLAAHFSCMSPSTRAMSRMFSGRSISAGSRPVTRMADTGRPVSSATPSAFSTRICGKRPTP